MNKKLIVLILFVFLVLSVVFISLFGQQPKIEDSTVTDIYFVDENNEKISLLEIDTKNVEANEDGLYVITIQLNYVVVPDDAANKNVIFKFVDEETNNIATVSDTGLLVITLDELVATSFAINVHCVDTSASFYQKFTRLDINILVEQEDYIPEL